MQSVFGIALLALVAQPSLAQVIYRCDDAGAVIYSDRPCAPGAHPHQIDDSRVTVYEPPAGAGRASKRVARPPNTPSKKSQAARQAAAARDQHAARCDKINAALRDIRTRMRTGYGVEEGERLKARQRQLATQRRNEQCQ